MIRLKSAIGSGPFLPKTRARGADAGAVDGDAQFAELGGRLQSGGDVRLVGNVGGYENGTFAQPGRDRLAVAGGQVGQDDLGFGV